MPISEATYERVALESREEETWELWDGCLRRKPDVTLFHESTNRALFRQIDRQLDGQHFEAWTNSVKLRRGPGTYFVPDVVVTRREDAAALEANPEQLAVFDAPAMFVAETWSPSTREYDVRSKLPEYRERGDMEVWLVDHKRREVSAWIRTAAGTYLERTYRSGIVTLAHLPGVAVDIDTLWR